MIAKAEIKINGRTYGGWKEVDVRRSLKTLTGAFSFSVTDKWSGLGEPWPISKGDAVTVHINSELVITGFLDSIKRGENVNERSIALAGRCKTSDLVDCSIDIGESQFFNQKLDAIAKKILAPFGLKVVVDTDVGDPIDTATIQVGESPFEFLDRLARKRAVLLTSNTAGEMVIARPGKERAKTQLVSGVNLKSCEYLSDMSDRFSIYKVKSQNNLGIRLQTDITTDFVVVASAKDEGVKRYRPKVIQNESNASIADANLRAQWEAKVRAARGEGVSAVVQGWTQSDGKLWKPNLTTKLVAPWLGLDEERLISEVRYSLTSSGGTTAALTLERRDAFLPEPIVSNDEQKISARVARDLREGGTR